MENEKDRVLFESILRILSSLCEVYQNKYDDDFRKVLRFCLQEYADLVEKMEDPDIYERVSRNCHYMRRIVRSFYQGRHSTAYIQLKNILKEDYKLFVTDIPAGELFYRMRCFEKRKGLSRKDLFHIPLNMRRKINTQRYSAPGYPCLYLGTSLYGCWEEMHRPNTESTLVSCFMNQRTLRVLDLRIPVFEEFKNNKERYLVLFPFIISCGIPVRNPDDIYKPEYIIPQLILEWIIDYGSGNNRWLDGVYYTSVSKNNEFYSLDHEWDNLAIPVRNALTREDYCPELMNIFQCTAPTCYEYERIRGNIDSSSYLDEGPNRRGRSLEEDLFYNSLFSRMEEIIQRGEFDYIEPS